MPSDIHAKWGARIRARRRELGISLDALAEMVGRHRSHVARVECGEVVPNDEDRPKYAAALNERTEDLFAFDPPDATDDNAAVSA